MKELALYKIIDGYEVVFAVVEAMANPAETINKIAATLNISSQQVTQHPNFVQFFEQNAIYFPIKPGERLLTSTEATNLKSKLAKVAPHEALILTGEVIPDWRGEEYHFKAASVWAKSKVEHIGECLPDGAVLPGDLTDAQRTEIAAQAEVERVAALTLEQRAAEKQARLEAAANEADRLSRRAVIMGTPFDTAAYYGEMRAEIEAKYTA